MALKVPKHTIEASLLLIRSPAADRSPHKNMVFKRRCYDHDYNWTLYAGGRAWHASSMLAPMATRVGRG